MSPVTPAAAPDDARRGERRGEHHVLAAPLEVARVVEGAALGLGQRLETGARDLEHRALDERRRDAGLGLRRPA